MKNSNIQKIRVALAGNANVGKSVIFNLLTGLHQHIGNWPGKTIERAVGSVYHKGYEIEIIDLPGIYSLSTYSLEEIISREFILTEKPDVIINVVDGSILERNLFFTLQLMELNTPLILLVNQMDIARSKGILLDFKKLETAVGFPVIPTVATRGIGFTKVLDDIVAIYTGKKKSIPKTTFYGPELEAQISKIQKVLEIKKILPTYPQRWLALKILEEDEEILKQIRRKQKVPFQHFRNDHKQPEEYTDILVFSRALILSLEEFHGHSCGSLITSERYDVVSSILSEVQQIEAKIVPPLRERIDSIILHPILGYFILFVSVTLLLFGVFYIGDTVSSSLLILFENLKPFHVDVFGEGLLSELIWASLEGLMGGISIALPYILPFYLILGILEDSGYMTRIAFLMDRLMHTIGLHGKAFIPCMLGIGCNVPACLGCRILERQRDRTLAIFIVTLIPCTAQTLIIFALVGKFLGFHWVLLLYLLNLLVIIILGKLALKTLPGEPMGLIMEMVSFRKPNTKVVLTQTWFRLKEFIYIALPLIIVGNIILKALEIYEFLDIMNAVLSPVTVTLLELPEEIGIALIFGIFRKELAVILLGTLFGTMDFATVMSPVQMIVFSVVTMFYIPCIATIAALRRELRWKKTLVIVGFEILFAIAIGVVVSRVIQFSSDVGLIF